MVYPPSLAFEASISGDGEESYDQDHQGTMHDASRSTNRTALGTKKAACGLPGFRRVADGV